MYAQTWGSPISGSNEPENGEGISTERGLPEFLGVSIRGIGRQVSRSVVYPNHALEDRTDEESRQDAPESPRAIIELVSR